MSKSVESIQLLVQNEERLEDYPIILAANRDEFLSRPTSSLSWHNFSSSPSSIDTQLPSNINNTLSGLDLEGGGTWLGISIIPPFTPLSSTSTSSTTAELPYTLLRFSTLTNFTETLSAGGPIKPSRGFLVKDFLATSTVSTTANYLETYLEEVESKKHNYAGFNLLIGELLSNGTFKMGYSSNRETDEKKSRILESTPIASTTAEGGIEEKVIGLSNSTVRLEKGKGWPKVESGIEGFEKIILSSKSESNEKDLVEGLYNVLSTAHSTPITERSHLRHTVLVRPIFFDPKASLPSTIPPLPTSSLGLTTTEVISITKPHELSPIDALEREGNNNKFWYGTRVQTILMIKKEVIVDGIQKFRVTMREREAYVLDKESGKPNWSGKEKVFEFLV